MPNKFSLLVQYAAYLKLHFITYFYNLTVIKHIDCFLLVVYLDA